MGSAVSARRRVTTEEEKAIQRAADPQRSLSTSKRSPLTRKRNSTSYARQARITNGGAGVGSGQVNNGGTGAGSSSNCITSTAVQPTDEEGNLVLTEKMVHEYIALERAANHGKTKKEQLVARWMEQSCPPVPNLFDQHALAMDALRSRQNLVTHGGPSASPVGPVSDAR